MAFEVLVAALAVGVAVLAYWRWPEATVTWFRRVSFARKVVFGIVAVAVALVLLGSGSPTLMLIGIGGLVWATWWILVDEPYETLMDMI